MPRSGVQTMFLSVGLCLLSAYAADNPWFGTWKLNQEKSTMVGDTYRIIQSGDHYREDNGVQQFDFAEDGWEFPIASNKTISVKKTGPRNWREIRKTNGTETSRTVRKLSSDGGTLSSHTVGTMADGTHFNKDVIDRRLGPGRGLAGTWKTFKDSSSEPETLVYSDAGHGAMRMQSLERKGALITHFDGAPAEEIDPQPGPKQALAIKASSAISYTWVLSMDGKPIAEGKNTIAPDGKSFTEVNWLAGKPTETYTMIYEKQ